MVEHREYRVSDIVEGYEIRKIVIFEGIEFHEDEMREWTRRLEQEYVGNSYEERYIRRYYLPYAKPPLDYLRENLGDAFEIEENPTFNNEVINFESLRRVGRYSSEEQKVRFIVMTAVSKRDFKRALETEGVHVIYFGHSRYGRGACFDIYGGNAAEKGEQWENGSDDDDGLYRLGYPYLPVSLEDIEKHGYTFTPVPVESSSPPSESRHPHARRKLSIVEIPENLREKVHPNFRSPSNRYYGLMREGKWHLILHAGWRDTSNQPFDLGSTELRCRVFCHFGCSSRLHFWDIVRKREYKGWERPRPPTDRYAYFTTAPADARITPLWLYYLLTYNRKNNFKPWWDNLQYAKRETNKKLRSINAGYEIY